MELTLSVRSFHVPDTPRTSAWPPSLPSVPTSRATRVTSEANELSWSTMVLMVFFSSRISPRTSTVIFLRQVAVGHRGGHLGDVAHLAGQVGGHEVDVVGQVLPGAGHALHLGLAAQLAFGAHLAGHAGHFRGEGVELVHHGVDGVLQFQNLALHVDGDLLATGRRWPRPWSPRRCCAPGRSGWLAMQFTLSVRSFQVPDTPFTSAWPPSLPSVPTSRATRVTSAAKELSWSTMVLMVFFSSRISPRASTVIFCGQVAVGHGGGHLGDVAHLAVRLAAMLIDVVGEVLPGAGHAAHVRLAAELAFGADFARHAGDLRGEGVELIHHRVDGVLQFENLALAHRR